MPRKRKAQPEQPPQPPPIVPIQGEAEGLVYNPALEDVINDLHAPPELLGVDYANPDYLPKLDLNYRIHLPDNIEIPPEALQLDRPIILHGEPRIERIEPEEVRFGAKPVNSTYAWNYTTVTTSTSLGSGYFTRDGKLMYKIIDPNLYAKPDYLGDGQYIVHETYRHLLDWLTELFKKFDKSAISARAKALETYKVLENQAPQYHLDEKKAVEIDLPNGDFLVVGANSHGYFTLLRKAPKETQTQQP